jgi:hypothetical protein
MRLLYFLSIPPVPTAFTASIVGLPVPPFTDPTTGHPREFFHAQRHLYQYMISEMANAPCHQLVFSQLVYAFINDASEAFRILKNLPKAGRIYAYHRSNPEIPNLISSDGGDFKLRQAHLIPALENLKLDDSFKVRAYDQYVDDVRKTCSDYALFCTASTSQHKARLPYNVLVSSCRHIIQLFFCVGLNMLRVSTTLSMS